MLVYIHVPFCKSKCKYCAFASWVPEYGETEIFLNALLAEIGLWGDRLGKKRVSTIFVGGGTPSTLPASAIGAILDRVANTFSLAEDLEVTMEANPQSGRSSSYYSDLLRAGVNRLSLGLQSMNDELLKFMGRPHTSFDAVKAMREARVAGFKNINLDLMWGLPDQRLRYWKEDLNYITSQLKPEHISCYGLTIEPHTPFYTLLEAGKLNFVSERELGHMFMDGAEILEAAGYVQYEISNFSKIGFQCKHNLGYWGGREYLGLGPAAVSTIKNRRWTNSYNLEDYIGMVKNNQMPSNVEELDLRTRVLELIMLSLRTNKGLSVANYRKLTGSDFFKDNQSLINALHGKALIRIRNKHVSLTRSGMLVSNTIMSHLFEALPMLKDSEPKFELENGLYFSAKAGAR